MGEMSRRTRGFSLGMEFLSPCMLEFGLAERGGDLGVVCCTWKSKLYSEGTEYVR